MDRYPIGTIQEMARIPSPQRDRFLAELPAILASIADMEEAMPELAQEAHGKIPLPLRWLISPRSLAASMARQMVSKIKWVDDDKGTGTLTMAVKSGEPAFWSRTVDLRRTGGRAS